MSQASTYRPEIDGLRAVAVLSVIAFHLNPAWLPGGFLGVDIFFIISGYLITSILLRDLQADRFSIRRFYERRARRILPALIVVVAACIPFAWLLMDATELQAFGQSLLAQVAFASNILFWQTSGYFAAPAETVPLLHTWSLAVEEQFYLFFPPALYLGWRYARHHLVWIMLPLAGVSLAVAEHFVWIDPSMAFYLLPFRGWELLAGAMLAQLEIGGHAPALNRRSQIAAAAGLLLVLYSLWTFTEASPHPSLQTVPLIIGTCLIVRYGRSGPAYQMLSLPPVVGVGLISYSLYLWHWPLLAFTRLFSLGELPANTWQWLLPACFALAWLTWRFVEQPARKQMPLRVLVSGAAATSMALVAFGLAIPIMGGFPGRLGYPASLEQTFAREDTVGTCIDNPGADTKAEGWFCELGNTAQGPIDFVVLGDSHAYAALPAFRQIADERGVRAVAISDSGCPPLLGIKPVRPDQSETDCQKLNERSAAFIAEERPRVVFLVARWTYYSVLDQVFEVAATGAVPTRTSDRLDAIEAALNATVQQLESSGAEVIVVGQVPAQKHSPREIYKRATGPLLNTDQLLHDLSTTRPEHEIYRADLATVFTRSAPVYLDPTEAFCDDDVCLVGTNSSSYYSDIDHLSIRGAARMIPLIDPLLGPPIVNPPARQNSEGG